MNRWLLLAVFAPAAWSAGVTVLFDPARPDTGPYPTDALTVADPAQRTGRRMNLPLPDCTARRAFCEDLTLVNRTDGYDLSVRLRVRFSAAPNIHTFRGGVWVVGLEGVAGLPPGVFPVGHYDWINEPVWDPATNTLYGRSDTVLDQQRHYALVITDAVRDGAGDPVNVDPAFTSCVEHPADAYCRDLSSAVTRVRPLFPGRQIVAASVFTTLSATAWLEQAWRAQQRAPVRFQRADQSPVAVADVESLVYERQVASAEGSPTANQPVPLALLAQAGRIAFGKFSTPVWAEGRFADPVPATGGPVFLPEVSRDIGIVAFLPATPPPAGGYPVVIVGHGLAQNLFLPSAFLVNSLVSRGWAVVSINAFGHGGGPASRTVVQLRGGERVEFGTLGRSVDVDRNGRFEVFGFPLEGSLVLGGPATVLDRATFEQTVLDFAQLARTIRAGVDLDGDGQSDLSGSRLAYFGHSMGAFMGTALLSLDPAIQMGVLNSGAGPILEIFAQSPAFQPLLAQVIGFRAPYLLSGGKFPPSAAALRYQQVKIAPPASSLELEQLVELGAWISAASNPVNWAIHLSQSTLPDTPSKRVLYQIPRAEPQILNHISSRWLRAANKRDLVSLYRGDVAIALQGQQIPFDTHGFLYTMTSPASAAVAFAAQEQVALFFESDGQSVPDVNPIVQPLFGRGLFETPTLFPEDPGFPLP